MSKKFGTSAADVVDSMKLIGSQAPELLKDSDALAYVSEQANILSGAAGIGVEEAARGITTVMNQMGASAGEAGDIINTLAAASQQGSADVAYLNTAFEKTGTAASSAGMSYVQTAALIEAIAPKFSSADVAGTTLNSTLTALATKASSEFNPQIVGLQQALDNMAAAGLSDAEMMKIVGQSNLAMLKTMIDSRGAVESYSKSLAGTNTAAEQFEKNHQGIKAALNTFTSQFQAMLLTIGGSSVFQYIQKNIAECIKWLGSFFDWIGETTKALLSMKTVSVIFEAMQKVIGSVLYIVKLLTQGFFELSAVVLAVCKKAEEAISKYLIKPYLNFIRFIKDTSWGQALVRVFNAVVEKIGKYIDWLADKWKAFKKWLGLDVGVNVKAPKKPSVEKQKIEKEIVSEVGAPSSTTFSTTSSTPSIAKVKPDVQPITSEDIAKIVPPHGLPFKATPEIPHDSIKAINEKISKLKSELEIQVIGSEKYNQLKQEIAELEGKKVPVSFELDVQSGDSKNVQKNIEAMDKADDDAMDKKKQRLSDVSDLVSSFDESFSTLGDSFEVPELNAVGIIAGAIASVIEGYGKATSMAASLGPFAWIAFALSGVAVLASVISQIKNLSANAGGGIISGTKTIGDYNLARVNSGEMILNGTQQKRLFAIANGIGVGNDAIGGGTVRFEISGDNLAGVLNNHNAKKRRVM